MTDNGKKMFLITSVVLPFLIYSIIYYAPIIRNAPFKAAEFVAFEYKWGTGAHLQNAYNSASGEYRYINRKDSLIIRKVKLKKSEFKYLDSVADVQGFWNLPNTIANKESDIKNPKLLRYQIKFHYQKKSKEVVFFPDFNKNEKMRSAAAVVQKTIENVINNADQK